MYFCFFHVRAKFQGRSDLSEVNRLVCRSIGCLEVFLELLAGVSLPALGINFIVSI